MGDAMAAALHRSGLTEQARRVRIALAWSEAVGETLAARTAPESLRRGVLLVRSVSPAWQNELTFLRETLIARSNAGLGEPWGKEIRVVSGHVRAARAPSDRPGRPLTPAETDAVNDAAQAIHDPELRDAFRRAIQQVARSRPPEVL